MPLATTLQNYSVFCCSPMLLNVSLLLSHLTNSFLNMQNLIQHIASYLTGSFPVIPVINTFQTKHSSFPKVSWYGVQSIWMYRSSDITRLSVNKIKLDISQVSLHSFWYSHFVYALSSRVRNRAGRLMWKTTRCLQQFQVMTFSSKRRFFADSCNARIYFSTRH